MGDLGLGRKTDQTRVEEALGRYPKGVANKKQISVSFQIHGMLPTSCAYKVRILHVKRGPNQIKAQPFFGGTFLVGPM